MKKSFLLKHTLKQISIQSQNWQFDIMQETYSSSRRQLERVLLQSARAKHKSTASTD